MQTVQPQLIQNKTVLLRLDLDVPLRQVQGRLEVEDDFRLEAGLDTLDLCLQYAGSVVIMGHIGRPGGKEVAELSVKPVADWFEERFAHVRLPEGKLHILENLRFEAGEDEADENFARGLASLGDIFVNESFAAHHPAASTTVLPALLPHAAGLRFAKEVETLLGVRNNPKKPLVAVIGGAKLEDKLAVLNYFAKIADAVLVGGKLPHEIREKQFNFPDNVLLAQMNKQGTDLSEEDEQNFRKALSDARQIIWAGPMGKYEDPECIGGTRAVAEAAIKSGAELIIGGGDTIAALDKLGILNRVTFISTGGGAMLELLANGTLPTIEALA